MWLVHKLTPRRVLTILHDVIATAVAIVAAFFSEPSTESAPDARASPPVGSTWFAPVA